jgi:RNA polymerase sigma factor (sigma-70 family)
VHDAFLAMYRRIARHGPVADPKPYLYKVATHRRRRLHQVKQRRESCETSAHEHRHRVATDPTSDVDRRLDLVRTVLPLTTRQRQVMWLHHAVGFTLAEVAEILLISKTTVETHLQRAQTTLRGHLGEEDDS